MSQITTPPVPPTPPLPPEDPFRYGWREVLREMPDGRFSCERLPLTLEDVLHPQLGDVMPHSDEHEANRFYLYGVLKNRLPDALVLTDCIIQWDVPGLPHHSPDISVIPGGRYVRGRTTYPVATEGRRPVLLIEVVSPNYRDNDVAIKVVEYHQAQVPFYVIVDREREGGPPSLIGYRWAPAGYQRLPLDEQGRLLLEPVGLLLGLRGERVVLYDAARGEELGDYDAVVRQAQAEAEARRAAEEQTRAQAEARRAAEEQARAEAEARRAAEEQARAARDEAARLQARLRELEEQLRQRPDAAPPTPPTDPNRQG